MQFTNPIWLWALSGLAIPVAIHLLSRKEGKVIYIGSLRHLEESNTRQFRAIKLNEILLLILRCILISLVVLLLAGLTISYTSSKPSRWLVIEPGIEQTSSIASLTDSLTVAGYEKHYLSQGFPIEIDTTAKAVSNYWSLIHQLQSKAIADIVVISRSRQNDFDGEYTTLPSNIHWITADNAESKSILFAQRSKADSSVVRTSKSNSMETSYSYQKVSIAASDTIKLQLRDTLTITIATNQAFQYDARIVEASLQAIAEVPAPIKVTITTTENFQYIPCHWLIWLSEKTIPVKDKCNSIVLRKNPAASSLFVRQGAQHPYQQWQLTSALTVDHALQEHLSTQLAAILLANDAIRTASARADHRTLPEAFLKTDSLSSTTNTLQAETKSTSLDNWLLILIALMLLTERLVSYQRNQ
ncbi:MAG TPA: BatA domain-containing protein [Ohtaekwangia sp.]|uniref:BatA domain-containing protein n=1 Tax=Ohtaekwangia sp. TaxID=2066019 RepID=UPI002F95DC12